MEYPQSRYTKFVKKMFNPRKDTTTVRAMQKLRVPSLFLIGLYIGMLALGDKSEKKESEYLKDLRAQFRGN